METALATLAVLFTSHFNYRGKRDLCFTHVSKCKLSSATSMSE
jgi:hypothetical protein